MTYIVILNVIYGKIALKNKDGKMLFLDYSDLDKLMEDWHERLSNAQKGHYKCSEKLYYKANWSGYFLILTTTIVTAMLFMNPQGCMKMFLVFMSILSAVLSGVVSFARYAEKAEKHRSAASRYGKVRRQLEHLNSKVTTMDVDKTQDKLKLLRIEWEYISDNALLTPESIIKTNEADNSNAST